MSAFLALLAAAAAGYGLLVLVQPIHRCGKCKGKLVVLRKSWWDGKPRIVRCPRCKGRWGGTRRLGAGVVHRFFWSVAGDRLRDRRKAQLKEDSDV